MQMEYNERLISIILPALLLIGCTCTNSEEVYDQCPYNKTVTLGKKPGRIKYNGYKRDITCHWTIPPDVKEKYVVILRLESTKLLCGKYLTFPGGKNLCGENIENGNCWKYISNISTCQVDDFAADTSDKRITCNKTEFWKDIDTPASITYQSGSFENEGQGFIIHYQPIKCNSSESTTKSEDTAVPPTDVTTTNNSSANTTDRHDTETPTISTLAVWYIIGIASGGFVFVAMLIAATICYVRQRSHIKKQQESIHTNVAKSQTEDTAYENHIAMTDEAGYEIPSNARQYENLRTDGQYENLKENDMYEDVQMDDTYANTDQ